MPDAIPDHSPLPYMLGTGTGGTFAYFGSGAVRRLHNAEIIYLRDEQRVRRIELDSGGVNSAAAVSKYLFNV
jgi:hypothetical protein